ncbi:MAG: ribosome small subunit-dependent GTPase A [Magnetococcales bacterium]|nr:ribosome small subunit-dependent GTPase A [Magnetococcales bacterium]
MLRRRTTAQELNFRQHRRIQSGRRQFLQGGDASPEQNGPEQNGLVLANYGFNSEVENEQGERFRCAVRETVDSSPAAGDQVVWRPGKTAGQGVIEAISPRHSELRRPGTQGRWQTVAANIDRLVVIFSPDRFVMGLADRYLIVAAVAGIEAILVVNKQDVLQGKEFRSYRQELKRDLKIYRRMGYLTQLVSAHSGKGLPWLTEQLVGRNTLLVGQSGVGKSSLIRHWITDEEIRVGQVNAIGRGRQTTSAARLYHLPQGGNIIDSAGIRALALQGIPAHRVVDYFRDVSKYAGKCRFSDCRHDAEPNCAVQAAVAKGKVDPRRLVSLHAIADSLEVSGDGTLLLQD